MPVALIWLISVFGIEKVKQMLSANVFKMELSDNFYKFIAAYESFQPKAYKVPGESFYTIGYGSTRIFSLDGRTTRPVKSTDMVNVSQAVFQLKMYYDNPSSKRKALDALISQYGFKLHVRFYEMLQQILYGSGGFVSNVKFRSTVLIPALQRANNSTDTEMLGELVKNTWVAYLKSYARYTLYGLGWSRRAYAMAQYVKGKDWSHAAAFKAVKKPF